MTGSEVFHPLTLCTNDHFSATSQNESRSYIHNAIEDGINVQKRPLGLPETAGIVMASKSKCTGSGCDTSLFLAGSSSVPAHTRNLAEEKSMSTS